jgi:hypothetical protein
MSKLQIANTFFEWELETQPKITLREAFLQNPIYLQLQFLPALYSEDPFLVTDREFASCETIESWGPSQLIAEWASVHNIAYQIPDWRIVKEVNSKQFSFENSPKLPQATLLTNETQARHWLQSFAGPKVLKSCFGVSGKGHLLIENATWDRIAGFLHAEWKKDLPVIAEPWVKRILDFSTQWLIENGQIIYVGATLCQNDARGQYQYNEVGGEKQWWHPYLTQHKKQVEPLLTSIADRGFFGNLGIDAMLYELDGIKLHPVVEINARKTMGWAALVFQRRHFPKEKIRFCYTKAQSGYLPNFLVLKNGKRVSFAKNLCIYN